MCLNHWDPGPTASIGTNTCTERGLLVAGPWPLENIDLVDDGEKSYPAGLRGGKQPAVNFTVETMGLPGPKYPSTWAVFGVDNVKVCFGCKSIVSIGRKISTLVGDSILLGWRTSHVKLFAGSFLEVVVLWELCLVHMELVLVEFAGNSHIFRSEIWWSPYTVLVSNSRNHWWTDAGFLSSMVWSTTKPTFSSRECHDWNFKSVFLHLPLLLCIFVAPSKFVFHFHHLP